MSGTLSARVLRTGLVLVCAAIIAGAQTMKVQLVTIDCENWPVDFLGSKFTLANPEGLGGNGWWIWADGDGMLRVRDQGAHSGSRCLYNDSEKWGFGMNLLADPYVESGGTYEVHVWAKAVDPSKPMKFWSNFPMEGGGGALAQSNLGGTFPKVSSTDYTKVVFTHNIGSVAGKHYVLQLEAANDGFNYGAGYVDDITLYKIEPVGSRPPRIYRRCPDVIAKKGSTARFWVHTTGRVPMSYQWYRDGQPISGATSSSHAVTGVGLEDSGSKFSVKVSNESGETTSEEMLLTVTESGGPEISYVGAAPTVDGTPEPAWESATALPIAKAWGKFGAEPANDADLSATAKTLWDDQNLYVWAEVKDAQVMSAGSQYARRDALELFVDIGNDKSNSFGADDFHFHFAPGAGSAEEVKHSATTGVRMAAETVDGGYVVEAAIPWTALGVSSTPSAGTVLGFDLGVRDVDESGELPQTYLVWSGRAENERSPSIWGVAQLVAPATQVNHEPRVGSLSRPGIVTDGRFVRADRSITNRWEMVVHSPDGRVVARAHGRNSIPRIALPAAGGAWVVTLSWPAGEHATVTVREATR